MFCQSISRLQHKKYAIRKRATASSIDKLSGKNSCKYKGIQFPVEEIQGQKIKKKKKEN